VGWPSKCSEEVLAGLCGSDSESRAFLFPSAPIRCGKGRSRFSLGWQLQSNEEGAILMLEAKLKVAWNILIGSLSFKVITLIHNIKITI
jgi:hypothetical protein